ncbi:MAG: ATP-binding protein [Fibrobacter sp.]|nr:ATP-binding protein [Fibrobacter sp.]
MKKHPVVTNGKFFHNTLRSVGYNTYTAIADIIDNSVEPEVGSTMVSVIPEYTGTGQNAKITAIRIVDNGSGMSLETLDEAMALGSETGKTGKHNLGMYGTGLKTAAFSMGQTLEVYSKLSGSDYISYAKMSLAEAIANGSDIEVEIGSYKTSEIAIIANDIGGHGTIVRISDLDRMKTFNYGTFVGTATKRLSIIFSKFFNPDPHCPPVDSQNANFVRMYVGNQRVPYVDVAKCSRFAEHWKDPDNDNTMIIDGHRIKYNVWFSPTVFADDEAKTDDAIHDKYIGRQMSNQGFYVFRQNRLIGQGLTFGLWARHPSVNGLHIEIFVDGDTDYLFGTGFTKTASDTTDIKEEVLSTFRYRFMHFVKQAQDRNSKSSKLSVEETLKKAAMYNAIVDDLNSKPTLRVPGIKATNSGNGTAKEHEHRGPQANPNPIKKRNAQWITEIVEAHIGEYGKMYECEFGENGSIVKINVDHAFYTEFYNKLDVQMQATMGKILACNLNALIRSGYFADDDISEAIESFFAAQSTAIRTALS